MIVLHKSGFVQEKCVNLAEENMNSPPAPLSAVQRGGAMSGWGMCKEENQLILKQYNTPL